jgi:DNA-binding Lrp family transcriptional regulator
MVPLKYDEITKEYLIFVPKYDNFLSKGFDNMNKIAKNLKDLGFSKNEITTYIALTGLGEAKAAAIAKRADLSRTTVINILERLEKEGLVSSNKYKGSISWWIESPHILKNIYENKISIANSMVDALSGMYRADHIFPGAKIYDTKEGIKNFTERLLISLKHGSIICTIDSPRVGNYQKIFSDEYNTVFVNLKKKRSIITRTLVPAGTFATIDKRKLAQQNITIRELPPKIEFESSVWFTSDVTVFFSSKPPYLVAIKNPAIYDGLKSIYDFLWQTSESKN